MTIWFSIPIRVSMKKTISLDMARTGYLFMQVIYGNFHLFSEGFSGQKSPIPLKFLKRKVSIMRQINIDGFIRVSKYEAKQRYNAGEAIRICACNMSPVSIWGCYGDCCLEADGEFETVVNAFRYYNCDNETGRYPAYYVKKG